jgi:hypothetical protein
MNKVYFLTDFMELDCVSNLNKIHILINNYINEYFTDLEFIRVLEIDEKGFKIFYKVLDLDTKEEYNKWLYFSYFNVISAE